MSSPWESPSATTTPSSSGGVSSNSLLAKAVVGGLLLQWLASSSTSVFGALMFMADEASAMQMTAALLTTFSALGLMATYLFVLVSWFVWQHRAASNLVAMGRAGLQFTPGWHIGWWFVPFANLLMPYRTMKELVLGSDIEQDADWSVAPEPSYLRMMWGFYIAGAILSNAATRFDLRVGTSAGTIGADLLSVLLQTVGWLLMAKFVLDVDKKQEAMVAAIGSVGTRQNP